MSKEQSAQIPVIFGYRDYKSYINHWIASQPNRGRGFKSKIAERIRCQLAYISQVLTGVANFSLEQAEMLNTLFNHSEAGGEFFLLLVERARAGTSSLEKFFDSEAPNGLKAGASGC